MDSIARQAKAQARIEQEDAQERLEEQARRKQFEAAGKQTTLQPPRKKVQPPRKESPKPAAPSSPENEQIEALSQLLSLLIKHENEWVSVRWISRQTRLLQHLGLDGIRTHLDRHKSLIQKQGEGKAALYRFFHPE
jgi:sRNA-binding protein